MADTTIMNQRFALADELSALLAAEGITVTSYSVAEREVALQVVTKNSQRDGVAILKAAGHKAKARKWPDGDPEIVVTPRK